MIRYAMTVAVLCLSMMVAGCATTQPVAVAQPTGPVLDFTVYPAVGSTEPFRLADARGQWVALHFLLKTECPVCIKYTHSYADAADELGVTHVFLKPDTDEEIATWAKKYAGSDSPLPPVYRDPDAKLAKTLGIGFGYQFHGQTMHYPALVLINPQGREVFRYVGEGTRDRYYPHRLSETLRKFRGH